MALTVKRVVHYDLSGGIKLMVFTLSVSAGDTYGAAGDPGMNLTRQNLGIKELVVSFPTLTPGGHLCAYDAANGKVRLYWPQGGSSGGANDGTGTGSIPAGATAVTSNAAQPTVSINTAPAREMNGGQTLSAMTWSMVMIAR